MYMKDINPNNQKAGTNEIGGGVKGKKLDNSKLRAGTVFKHPFVVPKEGIKNSDDKSKKIAKLLIKTQNNT